MKTCCTCKQTKSLDEFFNHKTRGKQTYCKKCSYERMKIYRNLPHAKAANRARWEHRSLPEKLAVFRRADIDKDPRLTTKSLMCKLGSNPHCYLTGRPIDLNDWASYSLDHIIPVSKGGKSTLENCGLTARQVNYSKNVLSPQEFISLCREVVEWNQKDSTLDNLNV